MYFYEGPSPFGLYRVPSNRYFSPYLGIPVKVALHLIISFQGEVAVLAGGYDGWRILDSVELFSPNDTCRQRLAPLPNPILGLVAFYLNDNLYACGGRNVQGFASSAYWRYLR